MLRFAALTAIALLLAPSLAAAQDAEPIGTVSEDETTVARTYDSSDMLFDSMMNLLAFGVVGDTEAQAIQYMDIVPEMVASDMANSIVEDDEEDATVGPVKTVSIAPIGDEATAVRVTYTLSGFYEGKLVVLAVRQSSWVQMLIGMGNRAVDIEGQLETLARQLLPRWPVTDPVSVRPDGLRVGGIWSMMPLPEDVPDELALQPEDEDGPAPGVTPPPPVATPATPAASPVPLTRSVLPPDAALVHTTPGNRHAATRLV